MGITLRRKSDGSGFVPTFDLGQLAADLSLLSPDQLQQVAAHRGALLSSITTLTNGSLDGSAAGWRAFVWPTDNAALEPLLKAAGFEREVRASLTTAARKLAFEKANPSLLRRVTFRANTFRSVVLRPGTRHLNAGEVLDILALQRDARSNKLSLQPIFLMTGISAYYLPKKSPEGSVVIRVMAADSSTILRTLPNPQFGLVDKPTILGLSLEIARVTAREIKQTEAALNQIGIVRLGGRWLAANGVFTLAELAGLLENLTGEVIDSLANDAEASSAAELEQELNDLRQSPLGATFRVEGNQLKRDVDAPQAKNSDLDLHGAHEAAKLALSKFEVVAVRINNNRYYSGTTFYFEHVKKAIEKPLLDISAKFLECLAEDMDRSFKAAQLEEAEEFRNASKEEVEDLPRIQHQDRADLENVATSLWRLASEIRQAILYRDQAKTSKTEKYDLQQLFRVAETFIQGALAYGELGQDLAAHLRSVLAAVRATEGQQSQAYLVQTLLNALIASTQVLSRQNLLERAARQPASTKSLKTVLTDKAKESFAKWLIDEGFKLMKSGTDQMINLAPSLAMKLSEYWHQLFK